MVKNTTHLLIQNFETYSSKISSILCLLFAFIFFLLVLFGYSRNADIYQKFSILANEKEVKTSRTEVGCDLFTGRWIKDESRSPDYTNLTCPTLPDSKNCAKYGKEQGFLSWRWKPEGCDLQRFRAGEFLNIVKGKKMAFVGDSVARNQMESLLCMLSQVETPVRMHGNSSEDRFPTWVFNSHNFTLMALSTRFLVAANERVINGSTTGEFNLEINKPDTNSTSKLSGVTYIVISSGHWFSRKNYLYEDGQRIGCTYCSEPNVTDLGIVYAIRRSFRTALQHINDRCDDCKQVTIVRTITPAHFEHGFWDSGGVCNRTRPYDQVDLSMFQTEWDIRNAQVEELERIEGKKKNSNTIYGVLDVSKAMMVRADAHPNSHWNNQWMKGYNDCLHWCLPGPIDFWNDLLLAVLKSV